jgi:hypothetical protein
MKLSMLLTAAGLSAAMTSGQVFAQDIKNQADLAGTTLAKTQAAPAGLPDAPPASTAAVSSINLHAIKDFKARFGHVKEERWYAIEKGFLAYFLLGGYRERAFYDGKGRWLASLIYGDEHKLPANIRDRVRRAYYDQPITFVQVIEVPDHIVYLVHVEDKATLKILRVSEEGEMDVMDEFTKQ